jgi:hypothetical protein
VNINAISRKTSGDAQLLIGGILGYGTSGVTIKDCLNIGDITGSYSDDCKVFAGGITSLSFAFGGSDALTIKNCVNAGNVSIKVPESSNKTLEAFFSFFDNDDKTELDLADDATFNDYLKTLNFGCAIVGWAAPDTYSISNCYSVKGEILAADSNGWKLDIASENNKYLDSSKAGIQSNYSGFDFCSTWSLGEQKGYPELL